MKNTLLHSAMLLTFVSTANAAAPLSPSLNLPVNNDVVAMKQPLKFTWTAKNPSTIKQYHLIISKNERFSDYDLSKVKCAKTTTCVDFVVKSASKTLPATHPFLQKEGSYFWQVQAIDKSNNKSPVFVGSKNSTTGSDAVRKRVNISQFSVAERNVAIDDINVTPKEAENGSAFTFTATLSDELPTMLPTL